MAQLVLGAVGAAVGSAFGPMGASVGWAIGAAVGGMLGPTQKSSGPRLDDLKVTASAYGTGVPHIFGHPRVSGTIIWASEKREIATTERQGKGGGGAEYTSYTYEIDLLFLLSSNELAGVRRIWSNGKLVWSIADLSDDETINASTDTVSWSALRFHGGAEDQLPDPTYEAAVGVGNAPAYRGRATLMLEGVNLGSSGQLPNLTFEVLRQATMEGYDTRALYNFPSGLADETTYDNDVTILGGAGIATPAGLQFSPSGTDDPTSYARVAGRRESLDTSGVFTIQLYVQPTSQLTPFPTIFNLMGEGMSSGIMLRYDRESHTGGVFELIGGTNSAISSYTEAKFPPGQKYHLCIMADEMGVALWVDGKRETVRTGAFGVQSNSALVFGTQFTPAVEVSGASAFSGLISSFKLTRGVTLFPETFTPPPEPLTLDSGRLGLVPDYLSEVVSTLTTSSGIGATQVDVAPLTGQYVHAMAVQPTSARAVLEQLSTAYYFECVESDGLYFRRRGSAPVAVIPYRDYGAEALLSLLDANDLELPAEVNVSYINMSNSYQQGNEVSDRITTDSTAVSTLQLGIGLTPAAAKAIADTSVLDQTIASRSASTALDNRYADLEPTDVVMLQDSVGLLHRARIVKISDAGGVRSLDLVADDARVLRELGITGEDYDDDLEVERIAATDLVVLDIPILRDQDDNAGVYAAGDGKKGTWPGYVLRVDGADAGSTPGGAQIGVVTEALPDWSSELVDEAHLITVTLNPGDQLVSITHEALTSGIDNYAAVGQHGRWEILQFRSATLVSPAVYRLTGMRRGLLGTEWARGTHTAGDRFVQLDGNGLLRWIGDAATAGQSRLFEAITQGARADSATQVTVAPEWEGLKPYAPVNLRVERPASGDPTITWDRRTRLQSNWLRGDVPLGEATERYEVEIGPEGGGSVVYETTQPRLQMGPSAGRPYALFAPNGVASDDGASSCALRIGASIYALRRYMDLTQIFKLDAVTLERQARAVVGGINGFSMDTDGTHIYVGIDGELVKYDLDLNQVARVSSGGPGDAQGVAVAGGYVWVANPYLNLVTQHNPSTLAVLAGVSLRLNSLRADSARTHLYGVNRATDQAHKLLGSDGTVTLTWNTGGFPLDAIPDEFGQVWVASVHPSGTLQAYDDATGAPVGTAITAPIGAYTTSWGVLSYVGGTLGCGLSAYVVVDAATREVLGRWNLPQTPSENNGRFIIDPDSTIVSPTLALVGDGTGWVGYYGAGEIPTGGQVRVYQISATVGRGHAATIEV